MKDENLIPSLTKEEEEGIESIQLTDEFERFVVRRAKERGISIEDLVREWLIAGLSENEDGISLPMKSS